MKRLLALLLFTLAVGCSSTQVYYDEGGSIPSYITKSQDYHEILGLCISACTLYLFNGCVGPKALLTFHGPRSLSGELSDQSFDYWSKRMADYYPTPLAEWFMVTGRFNVTTMNQQQLIALGVTPCN